MTSWEKKAQGESGDMAYYVIFELPSPAAAQSFYVSPA
jgi:hypothetical protein